jgi:hypothetical protein
MSKDNVRDMLKDNVIGMSKDNSGERPKRHVPPARQRWAARHRTIGVTVSLEDYEHLRKMRARHNMSFGRLFKEALDVLERDLESARLQGEKSGFDAGQEAGEKSGYEAGYEAGHHQAKGDWTLTVTCPGCGETRVIEPGSVTGDYLGEQLLVLGWHAACRKEEPQTDDVE